MALLQPIALNNATTTERPPAAVFRLMLDALGGSDNSADLAGVVGAGSLKVTQHAGTANNTVDIALGHGFCEATEGASAGCYYVYNDATVSIAVTTGNATNPRKDLVIVEVEDSAEAGVPDDAHFVVVAGTAAASPVDPDLQALGYDNYIVLARIDVPALDTVITNSQITDMRKASSQWARGRGVVGTPVIRTTNANSLSGTTTVGMSVSFTGIAGRRYKTTAHALLNFHAIGQIAFWDLRNESNTSIQQRLGQFYAPVATAWTLDGSYTEAPLAAGGSLTRTMVLDGTFGGNVIDLQASATAPATLVVEDVGGALL